jgi:hypothetical protein
MEFIKFLQPDPHYGKGVQSEVVVAVGQIVKIEPVWYVEDEKEERWRTHVAVPSEVELQQGCQKEYRIHDSLGNVYDSETASQEGRQIIERIWLGAK